MKRLFPIQAVGLVLGMTLLSQGAAMAADSDDAMTKPVSAIPVQRGNEDTDAKPATPSAKAIENRKGQQGLRMRKLHARDAAHRNSHSLPHRDKH